MGSQQVKGHSHGPGVVGLSTDAANTALGREKGDEKGEEKGRMSEERKRKARKVFVRIVRFVVTL